MNIENQEFRLLRRAVSAALLLAACGDGPVQPPPPELEITRTGWVERGATVRFTASLDGVPATGVTWTAEPAAAVQWLSAGDARMLAAGPVRVIAAVGTARDTISLDVAVPPSLVFERLVNGQRDLWKVALDGADLVQLVQHTAEERWPTVVAGSVFFASYRNAPAAVYKVPVAGGTAERVTTVNGVYDEVAVAADGRLAFVRAVGGIGKVFISDPSGANPRRADPASSAAAIEVSPAWSPDGTRLVYVSTTTGNADVFVVSAAGGAPQALTTNTAPDVEPAWSADNSQIAFARPDATGTHLFTINVTTRQERQITNQAGTQAQPAWLADGRIVFNVTNGGVRRLHWVDPAVPNVIYAVENAPDFAGRPAVVR